MRTPRSNASARVVLIAVLLAAGTAHAQSVTDDLVKVVVVSRHGVRTPLPGDPKKDPKGDKNLWTLRQEGWPKQEPKKDDWNPLTWPHRDAGELTKAGTDLAKLMGGYYRDQYARLLPDGSCPQNTGVFIRADVDERTEATAAAIAAGLSPCPFPVHTLTNQKRDPLFHPTSSNMVCALGGEKARDSIVKRLPPGGFGALDKQYTAALSAMQEVLNCCQPALCSLYKRGPSCKLTDLPTDVRVDGDTVKMEGAIGTASTAAEIFLLEYDNGNSSVGWGVLDDNKSKMATLLTLHNLQFEYMQRTRYIAKRQGSMLLRAVQAALLGQPFPGTKAGPLPPADAKFVVFVGHDTNIANLAALLLTDWPASEELPDKTAPTGALVFELRERAGTRYVNAYYVAQTVDQARGKTPPNTTSNRPFTATLHLPCVDPAGGPGCPLSKPAPGKPAAPSFEDLVNTAVDTQCVR